MRDDLDQYIADRAKKEPGFAALVKAAERRRKFARELATRRTKRGISQTMIAARMETSASIVSRLESGADVRISTLEKYLAALGLGLLGLGLRTQARVVAGENAGAKR